MPKVGSKPLGHSKQLLQRASPRPPTANTFGARPPCPESGPGLNSAPKLEKTTRPKIPAAARSPTPIPLQLAAKQPASLPTQSRIWAGWRTASRNQCTTYPAKLPNADNGQSLRTDFAHNATTKRQGSPSRRCLGPY